MSAPTPAPGDESPREGYYPDPSIPGYVRYWNGASWVPGTSRPAPRQASPSAASAAAPAAGAQTAPVEETGPIFFDEEDGLQAGPGSPAGPGEAVADQTDAASVWQADSARQQGFGGERDRRVDWAGPAQEPAGRPSPSADPRAPLAQDPTGGALPGMREGGDRSAEGAGTRPPTDGTVTIRAVGPQPKAVRGSAPAPHAAQPHHPAPSDSGTPQGPQNVGAPQNPSAARNGLAPAPEPRALPAQAQQPPQQAQRSQPPQHAQPSAPAPARGPAPTPAPQEVRQGPVQVPATPV
ncbi:DUF2510 domain-containing protein, partial [Streptomyces sp. ADI98-10]|uniref:DUF2510 domain-containing protein n=1 Tax=Streptomyces sp. ADI98-10 TaxID=1522763 RepID=UPI0013DE4B55